MQIVWSDLKAAFNLRKHGIDFADFSLGFEFDSALVVESVPSRTRRRRLMLVGRFSGRVAVAIVSPLGSEALSLVSFRWANTKERKAYDGA